MRTAVWQGTRLAVVEDVPALVCQACLEQYYDDDVSDALRRLNETGFPESDAERTIEVPVFTLKGRIKPTPRQVDEDVPVDY